jgi:hypothetical protein
MRLSLQDPAAAGGVTKLASAGPPAGAPHWPETTRRGARPVRRLGRPAGCPGELAQADGLPGADPLLDHVCRHFKCKDARSPAN